jgi:hypothetical protein
VKTQAASKQRSCRRGAASGAGQRGCRPLLCRASANGIEAWGCGTPCMPCAKHGWRGTKEDWPRHAGRPAVLRAPGAVGAPRHDGIGRGVVHQVIPEEQCSRRAVAASVATAAATAVSINTLMSACLPQGAAPKRQRDNKHTRMRLLLRPAATRGGLARRRSHVLVRNGGGC